jgi:hypothetical protein
MGHWGGFGCQSAATGICKRIQPPLIPLRGRSLTQAQLARARPDLNTDLGPAAAAQFVQAWPGFALDCAAVSVTAPVLTEEGTGTWAEWNINPGTHSTGIIGTRRSA